MTRTIESVKQAQLARFGDSVEHLVDVAKAILAALRYKLISEPIDRVGTELADPLHNIELKGRTLVGAYEVKLVPLLFTLAEAWRLLGDLERESSLVHEGHRIVQKDLYDWGPALLDPWAPGPQTTPR